MPLIVSVALVVSVVFLLWRLRHMDKGLEELSLLTHQVLHLQELARLDIQNRAYDRLGGDPLVERPTAGPGAWSHGCPARPLGGE